MRGPPTVKDEKKEKNKIKTVPHYPERLRVVVGWGYGGGGTENRA